jgi:hypothetical protein
MLLRILAGSAVALGLGVMTEGAHAGQTFMCTDGRLLQVKLADLERMKRQEPCVAAYYGIAVQSVPLPVQRPALPSKPALKGAQAETAMPREIGNMAEAASNYRNVRIINARRGQPAWFTHAR